jgi:hypothetical protein
MNLNQEFLLFIFLFNFLKFRNTEMYIYLFVVTFVHAYMFIYVCCSDVNLPAAYRL